MLYMEYPENFELENTVRIEFSCVPFDIWNVLIFTSQKGAHVQKVFDDG